MRLLRLNGKPNCLTLYKKCSRLHRKEINKTVLKICEKEIEKI